MATLTWLRTETIANPIATWDEIEASIANAESKIHAVDVGFTYTPFVPDTRLATWVLTKTEIQGLEDRLHAVAVYLEIPHLLTSWSGLMPVNYNALNHFILGLQPKKWIDDGYDPDGDLAFIMPTDYDPDIYDIDFIWEYNYPDLLPHRIDALLGVSQEFWPLQIYDDVGMSFIVGERYHIYVAVEFENEVTMYEDDPVSHFRLTFYGSSHEYYDAHVVMAHARVSDLDRKIILVDAVIDLTPFFIRVYYDGLSDIRETVSQETIPLFWMFSAEGPS